MRKLACVGIALSLSLSAGAASAETKLRFALDWAVQGIHGMFTLADDNGQLAGRRQMHVMSLSPNQALRANR